MSEQDEEAAARQLWGRSAAESAGRLLDRVLAVTLLAAMVGLLAWWPTGSAPDLGISAVEYVDAQVTAIGRTTCSSIEVPGAEEQCRRVGLLIESGPAAGSEATMLVADTQFEVPELAVGDEIVTRYAAASPAGLRYGFSEFQRGPLLWVLAAVFAAVVVAFARKQGVRALLGLAVSAVMLVVFVVPALLRDAPPLGVSVVAATLMAFAAIYLAHGVNRSSSVALAGTLGALAFIALLSVLVTSLAHLSGLSTEEAQVLRITSGTLDLRGLIIAGMVIGALGILDDVTVTQVSAVLALRRANPAQSRSDVFAQAMTIGRDHIASTVNTLVLAYAGAALPLLLFFAMGTTPAIRTLTSEVIAVEVVRMLVGSIGLVLSVPLTTWLAALVLSGEEESSAPPHVH